MQAVARHDIGLAAEDAGGALLHVHQFIEAELALFVIEKQIDVGFVFRLVARGRSEQKKMFDAKPLQIGFVLQQAVYGFSAFHKFSLA